MTNNFERFVSAEAGLYSDFRALGIGASAVAAVRFEMGETYEVIDAGDLVIVTFQGGQV